MIKVKVIKNFLDLEKNILRTTEDEEFNTTEERFEEINSTERGVLIKQINFEKKQDKLIKESKVN